MFNFVRNDQVVYLIINYLITASVISKFGTSPLSFSLLTLFSILSSSFIISGVRGLKVVTYIES